MKWIFVALAMAALNADATVLATVGNNKITLEEFNTRFEEVRKKAYLNPPSKEQYLEDLIRYEIGVQEAEKMKLASNPLVKERFKQVLYNSLLEEKVGKPVESIKINEAEMKEFYKKNPELRLAHILIELKADAKPEERQVTHKRAAEIFEDIKKSKKPFEDLVRLYSDDLQTKEVGGDIGYQSRVTLLPTIYEAAVNMKEGEIKGLLETRQGFHVVKLLDRRKYELADKRQIRASLFDHKRAKIFNDYFERTKKSYKIEVNKELLKSAKK